MYPCQVDPLHHGSRKRCQVCRVSTQSRYVQNSSTVMIMGEIKKYQNQQKLHYTGDSPMQWCRFRNYHHHHHQSIPRCQYRVERRRRENGSSCCCLAGIYWYRTGGDEDHDEENGDDEDNDKRMLMKMISRSCYWMVQTWTVSMVAAEVLCFLPVGRWSSSSPQSPP